MLQMPTLVNIVDNTIAYKSLGDSLLPVNNNAEFMSVSNTITVTICDSNKNPISFGSIVKCNEKQAYVMIGEVAEDFRNKTVWIEQLETENKINFAYKVTKCIPLVDYSGETHFEQTFANRDEKPVHLHLLDILIEKSVGLASMDTSKNITVDFEKHSNIDSWRDTVGFVVSDKYLFEKITVNRFELLALEQENDEITIETVDVLKPANVLDYDAEVSLFDREEFLTALMKTGGVSTKVAKSNGNVVGYVIHTNSNILQCYGEEETVQRALLSAAANGMSPKVNMCVRKDSNNIIEQLSDKAEEKVLVTRMNTRVVVNTIKWNKVACLNMGLHLF